ncbi:kelch-like protein [Dermatophagoides farinae]|nr:kelch-like protein [Dermatophagoides farinae]
MENLTGSRDNICHNTQMNFEDTSHIFTIFTAMNEMRKIGQLCDITLEVAGTKILAHKVVLAANSAYFNAMFNSEMIEKSMSHIEIREIDPNALKLLIEFIYTGQLTITEANVLNLLPASSLLQLMIIRETCCRFLLNQLHPSNCLGIRKFADTHSCQELQVCSLKYALDNFQEVSLTEEFLSLSYEGIISLISDNHLNVADEETVYDATIRWIKHDSKSREIHFPTLLSHVRLPLIERNFLINQILAEPFVRENNQAKDLVIEAMKYHLSFENRSGNSPRTQHRKPDGLTEFIFAIGGGSLFTTHNECEFFDPRDNTWLEFTPTNQRRSRAGVTCLHRYIYVIGGYNNGSKTLSSAEFFDPLTNVWTDTTAMGTKRSCHGVAELNNIIYAVGGYDGINCLSSAERFDPLISAWFSVNSLEIKRRYTRLLALNGSLYVVGGFDGANHLASVERYDPREGKWIAVAPMLSRRSSCGATVMDNKIYVAGGNDGTLCMSSAQRYDPVRNAWENISSMQNRRSTHELVEINGLLYALGGNDGSNSLNTVEFYTPEDNKWSMNNSMILRRSGLGAVKLECCDLRNSLTDSSNLEKSSPYSSLISTKSLDLNFKESNVSNSDDNKPI